VRAENLESSLYLVGGGATADVEEVSGLASLKLNDIHGGHGETCTIDHASDISIKGNIVKTSSNSLGLIGISVTGSIT